MPLVPLLAVTKQTWLTLGPAPQLAVPDAATRARGRPTFHGEWDLSRAWHQPPPLVKKPLSVRLFRCSGCALQVRRGWVFFAHRELRGRFCKCRLGALQSLCLSEARLFISKAAETEGVHVCSHRDTHTHTQGQVGWRVPLGSQSLRDPSQGSPPRSGPGHVCPSPKTAKDA